MTSVLTEEQKQRIEANKQKALLIRALKSQNPVPQPTLLAKPNASNHNLGNTSNSCSGTTGNTQKNSSQNQNSSQKFYSNSPTQPQPSSWQSKFKKSFPSVSERSNIVAGICVLVAPDRFTVIIAYCQPLITAFQTIAGRIYGE